MYHYTIKWLFSLTWLPAALLSNHTLVRTNLYGARIQGQICWSSIVRSRLFRLYLCPSGVFDCHLGHRADDCPSASAVIQPIIGSDSGLSPAQRQAIIWNNACTLLIGPLGTNCNNNGRKTSIFIQNISLNTQMWLFVSALFYCNVPSICPRPPWPQPSLSIMYHDRKSWL